MKRTLLFLALVTLLYACSPTYKGKEIKYDWKFHYIDKKYDNGPDRKAAEIISDYQPQLNELLEIIGYSTKVYSKATPESELSNFAADMVKLAAEDAVGTHIDIGYTNFGGIRTDLPAGDVRAYDIISIFPFDNYLVVCDIKGNKLRSFFQNMARSGRVEALSGVELVIKNKKVDKCLVGGRPIDDNRIYKLATINFLLDGGDDSRVGSISENVTETDIFIRDAIIEQIKKITARGEVLDLHTDGRVKILN